jgi:DNA mismatch repair ATPase MutL
MKLKNRGIGIILAPLIIVAVLLYSHFFVDNKSPAVSVSDKAITISTQFGTTINLSDIKDIEEKASAPADLSKISGYNDGTTLRGEFQSEGNTMMVYVNLSQPPFIYITTKSGLVIVNDQTSAETQSLYEQLKSKINQS